MRARTGGTGLGYLDLGQSLCRLCAVIARIYLDEWLAGFHSLVLGHEDAVDVTGNLRRDGNCIGLNIGVVRRFLILSNNDVSHHPDARSNDRERSNRNEQQPQALVARPGGCGLAALLRFVEFGVDVVVHARLVIVRAMPMLAVAQ